nr:hypothetical protein BaRGS_012595 [Batillaria attramentaria]
MLPVFWSVIGSVKRLFAIVGVSRTPKVDDFVKAVFTTGRRQTETLYYAKVLEVVDAEGESECLLHYLKEKMGSTFGLIRRGIQPP